MRLVNIVLIISYEVGWHSRGSQTVGFETRQIAIWQPGVEMEAQKQIGLDPIRDGDPIRECQLSIVRAG